MVTSVIYYIKTRTVRLFLNSARLKFETYIVELRNHRVTLDKRRVESEEALEAASKLLYLISMQ